MITGPRQEVSNRADFTGFVNVVDVEHNNEPVDLTDHKIQIEIATQTTPPYSSGNVVARATTDDGSIAILALGVFEFFIPVLTMRGLAPTNYDVGCTMTFADRTSQWAIGRIGLVDGVVRTAQ